MLPGYHAGELRETVAFSREADRLLAPEAYRALQLRLIAEPTLGKVIPGSGGLRKMRWGAGTRGKRGGVRLIYQWIPARRRIYLLAIYSKAEQTNLTAAQIRALRSLVETDPVLPEGE